jgi:hypothetical protein
MPTRWERELRRIGEVPVPRERIRIRASQPPGPVTPGPSAAQRVAAGVVAAGVFLAAAAFGWQAFTGEPVAETAVDTRWPVATIELEPGSATLSIGEQVQGGVFGRSRTPDESYPYRWENPEIAEPVEIPLGAELRVDGDVRIREILYGDADELDAGKGPDRGPIWSDQPTFHDPYFPPNWDLTREYWKLFGTWADGSVLDVYFEVRWVEPAVDLTDPSVDIRLTPETLDAELFYGGQRYGTWGEGTYGGMSVTGEFAGYGADTVYFPIAADSSVDIVGEDLESWTLRFGPRSGIGEGLSEPMDRVPSDAGRAVMHLSVVWGDGAGSFRFPVEIVPSDVGEPVVGPIRFDAADGWSAAAAPGAGDQPAAAWTANLPFPSGSDPSVALLPDGFVESLPSEGVFIVAWEAVRLPPDPANPNFPVAELPLVLPGDVESSWEAYVVGKGRSAVLAQVNGRYLQIWIFYGTPEPSDEVRVAAQTALARLIVEPPPAPVDLPPPVHDGFRIEPANGGLRFWPRSAQIEQGVVYRFVVPHCGLDWLVDFDGSFWEPVYDMKRKPDVSVNQDVGTIELVNPNEARYVSSKGLAIRLLRVDGPIVRPGCL